ncbi:hypothetical protein PSEUBRA_005544 [Kalmanozyma brasiliensis GHG001]|uniref:uncharacterized protein n=1 Tax=Kalmanozyma brasiliensis (strain GHG001) TaxID=1365824 RepID=UPI00286831E6|nr:uncharacterized protein PSEUBRA_005544 [Kalmanozyma brasiliensis GHG001]KAF6767529.1 hypothetical protein PSEUBRA_005544 [Kalmanozyma brasiliensis GHG001]
MTLQNDLPRRFVKHVVRRSALVARQAVSAAPSATSSAQNDHHKIARTQTSSLEAPVVAILLGGFLGTFFLFVLIGVTCKYVNRPRTDARRQPAARAMYQPSAAGYGSAAAGTNPNAAFRPNESMHDLSSPNAGLLTSAQPMGRGGRYEEAADDSLSSNGMGHDRVAPGVNGGYGMMPSHSASSFSGDESQRFGGPRRGHARGASSGIELPGPTASATFRRNVSGSHPPVHSNADDSYDSPRLTNGFTSASVAPDGSGFTPGALFDHGAYNGAPSKSPNDQRDHRTSYLDGPPAGVLPRRASLNPPPNNNPQQRPYLRGPPPASSNNRRSRYHQNQSSGDLSGMRRSRIDSVGPGTYRKSMFMSQDGSYDHQNGSQIRRNTSKNNGPKSLRRVESIGKGDPRRSSRFTPNNRTNRPATIVAEELTLPPSITQSGYRDGLPASSGDALLSVGVQDGRRSPYSGSSNGSSSPLGPLGPNDPMLPLQQQQQQQQYMAPPPGGPRMMPYGAGFGASMPRPGMPMSSQGSFAPAAPLGAGLGRGMEAPGHAASRQIL